MGKESKINWTTHTFNPWWGCVKVSDGCKYCYAESFSKRTGNNVWGVNASRRFFGDKHWNEPLKWNEAAKQVGERHRVFCASMADVFEDREDLHAPRTRLFDLIRQTPELDWLLLTKRPENIMPAIEKGFSIAYDDYDLPTVDMLANWDSGEPPVNVWLGTSVENQKAADERIPHLLRVPAAVRFLSCEPLLGAVDIRFGVDPEPCDHARRSCAEIGCCGMEKIHWVIAGGESGNGARPMQEEWARSLMQQCKGAGVAFWMKQLGGVRDKRHELEDLPEDLRVRELPKVAAPA